MLDAFSILTTSGVVLWSRNVSSVAPAVINSFIADVFIESKAGVTKATDLSTAAANPPYRTEQRTLRWALVKELGLIFVAVYNSLLHLTWIDKLVDNAKLIFVNLYGEQLARPYASTIDCHNFDEYFDHQLKELELAATKTPRTVESAVGDNAQSLDDLSAPGLNYGGHGMNSAGGDSPPNTSPQAPAKLSRRARKMQNVTSAPVSSGDESASSRRPKSSASSKPVKKGRKWDADGTAVEVEANVQLDYSARGAGASSAHDSAPASLERIDPSTWGTTTKGKFVLKDLDDEVHGILAEAAGAKSRSASKAADQKGFVGSGLSTISGLFRNVVGGKLLTAQDLEAPLKGMEEHLLKKNVAREAAVRLCESVERELLGLKTGSFETIHSRILSTMESTLTKMLTPTTSLDLLREIDAVTRPSPVALMSSSAPRPYIISMVGVNGVGKSTNLAKICYFLLQNHYRVLIVASDTFRSGAVEQLKKHVHNLSELATREANGSRVELFERGYGKDAATIAREAVTTATRGGEFDVILIDTAGRRHNDQRLMSDLEKFATLARPDKILMVAEALVGTDSVAQARNFNGAFGRGRGLDGFLISKCDTVGDMVGSIVSLVHATNVPVLFVGVGQHYSDLRNFSTKWAVEKLLSSE